MIGGTSVKAIAAEFLSITDNDNRMSKETTRYERPEETSAYKKEYKATCHFILIIMFESLFSDRVMVTYYMASPSEGLVIRYLIKLFRATNIPRTNFKLSS